MAFLHVPVLVDQNEWQNNFSPVSDALSSFLDFVAFRYSFVAWQVLPLIIIDSSPLDLWWHPCRFLSHLISRRNNHLFIRFQLPLFIFTVSRNRVWSLRRCRHSLVSFIPSTLFLSPDLWRHLLKISVSVDRWSKQIFIYLFSFLVSRSIFLSNALSSFLGIVSYRFFWILFSIVLPLFLASASSL